MSSTPLFGPAGLSDSYKALYKDAKQAVGHSVGLGLTAFEYQSGHGVRIREDTARQLARDAGAQGLRFSMHAPYYISMASPEAEKRDNSLGYLLQSAQAVRWLGGNRVVFHPGGAGRQPRRLALEAAADTLRRARRHLDEAGYEDIFLCPETMGKVGQLGTLDEVLALCQGDARHIPCIDFGHLDARGQGVLATKADFAAVLDAIEQALGQPRAGGFHVHFSRIEHGPGGEKRHHTFADTAYGPDYKPLIELLAKRGLAPVVICESSGTQAEDARAMQQYYNTLTGREA